MKRRLRRIVSWLCVLSLCLSLLPGTAWATGSGTDGGASDGAPTLEKTATDLENDQTKVELSIGSTEEKENVAVLFVLDYSTSVYVRDAAEAMLEELAEKENTNIQVCVINYWAEADTGSWINVTSETDTSRLLEKTQNGGTNLHGGLLAAQEALESSEIDDYETYLITISDGLTYLWTVNGETMYVWYQQGANGEYSIQNGNSVIEMKYPGETAGTSTKIPDEVFENLVNGTGEIGTKYNNTESYFVSNDSPYTEDTPFLSFQPNWSGENGITVNDCLIGTEIAIYKSAAVYKDLVDLVDHAYALKMDENHWEQYPYGEQLMDWLIERSDEGSGEVTDDTAETVFDDIRDQILYEIQSGTVTDVIGEAFDLSDKTAGITVETFTLTVGGVKQNAVVEGNTVKFGDVDTTTDKYPYVVTYYPEGVNGDTREQFVWEINVPVESANGITLSYDLTLVNKSTEEGPHTVPTNEEATLEYESTDGPGGKEDFPEPEVEYTVEQTTGTLTVTKYVADGNARSGETFTIEVRIGDTFEKIYLANGESKIYEVPYGSSYTVAEVDDDGYNTTLINCEGTIDEDTPTANAVVINVPVDVDGGALVISKTVNGDGDLDREFGFTVTFNAAGSYTYTGSKTGNITSGETVKLKNGETISINNLPEGTTYTVTEEDAENYTTTISSHDATDPFYGSTAEGTIVAGAAATAHYTNTYEAPEPPAEPGLSVEKDLTAVNGRDYTGGRVEVGDELTYTILVKNTGNVDLTGVTVTDTMTEGRAVTWGTPPGGVTANEKDNTLTIASLAPGASVSLTATYAVTEDDLGETIVNTAAATAPGGPTDDDTTTTTVDNGGFSVKITPADITIYTGGDVYGGVTDENGDFVVEDDDVEASGLPEPGYRIELSQAVMDWLNLETGEAGARDLADYLTFTYEDDVYEREWKLTYMGVYSTNPVRYVYSMSPVDPANPEVRIEYTDPAGNHYFDDDITMDADTVSAQYTMSIYGGELDRHAIQAVLTVDDRSITANVEIEEGILTIRSTTNEEYVNEIVADETDVDRNAITAVADDVTYYVNDSEVEVAADRVSLLVDEVSNNNGFDREMARDAIDHAIRETPLTSHDDLSYDMAYMDLVDTRNGNAVVTMDEKDSLTIYWPMPDDAENREGDRVYIIHYVDMDRETTYDDLSEAAKDILYGTVVELDGELYAEFDVNSFSPFVLVYEEEDNDRPTRPDPDPDDDKDDEDEEPEEDLSGLNTTDHYAYIAGYTDGTVRPDGNIIRAEVATIFFRLMTDEYRETCWSTSSGFTDVTAANWYNNAISTTANAGWVSGYPDGTFRPDAYITRAEFATIAARFLSDVYGGTSMFTDISGHWAEDYINRAAAAGWINGYADGTFRPNAYITRAEAVTLINRMLDRAPDANHLLADMVRWPDNPETSWYYADIQEATNSHDYTRAGTGNYEVWTELLANRDWAALEEIWSQANDAPGGEVMG